MENDPRKDYDPYLFSLASYFLTEEEKVMLKEYLHQYLVEIANGGEDSRKSGCHK
jgi:hypothetical protein